MSHSDVIKKNYDVLLRCTTINYYVIDFLRAEDVLNETQESDLKTEKNPLKQRILFLQWLKEFSISTYESFLQVMELTEQEHVANLLRGSKEEDHLPLSDGRYTRLVKIRHKIANVISIDNEVIAELRSLKAISRTDAEEIRAEKVDYTKISKLISAIMRRSNHSYNSFQVALRKTLQTAAADFLSEGEMPAVHINNNRSDLDGPLAYALNHVIMNRTTADKTIKELLERMTELGIEPVKAIPGNSIVIFIYCKTVQNAVTFTQFFNSGRLQCILEGILNRLLRTVEPHHRDTLDSSISLEDEESITLEEFTGIEGWMAESFTRPKSLNPKYGHDAATQTGEESFVSTNSDTFSGKVLDPAVTIDKNMATLLRCVNVNVYTVVYLRAAGVIDQAKESRLVAEKDHHDRLCLLLDWIKRSPYTIYESFLKVMEENEQQHVANLLRGVQENNHVPLSPVRYARLLNIRLKLMRMIQNNDALIDELISLKAISEADAENLKADKGPKYRKNYRLINAILRRSDYSFECLCAALRETHHTEAADYLVKDEAIAVSANTARPDLDEKLSESLNRNLKKKSMDETEPKRLEMSQLQDVASAAYDLRVRLSLLNHDAELPGISCIPHRCSKGTEPNIDVSSLFLPSRNA